MIRIRKNRGRVRIKRRPVDENDRVVVDVLCVRCGASLRGQVIGNRCTNCLHPVSDSVYGDYLVHADREYVRGLVDAARFVRIGAGFLGAIVAVAWLLALFTSGDFNTGVDRAFDVLFAGALITPLLAVIGIITLTARRSLAYYRARYGARRQPLWLSLAGLAVSIGLLVAMLYVGSFVAHVLLTVWTVAPLAVFLKGLASLLARVPHKVLATFARMAYAGVLLAGPLLFGILTLRRAGDDWTDVRIGSEIIAVILGIAGAIALYRLLLLVERQLLRAAR